MPRSILRAGAVTLFVATLAAGKGVRLRGIVHDPQHRPVAGAVVRIQGRSFPSSPSASTNSEGEFTFPGLKPGLYTVRVSAPGFEDASQPCNLPPGGDGVLHVMLRIRAGTEQVQVKASPEELSTQNSTVGSSISSQQIERTPGADTTNSLAMITDYVPGASVVHDMLHVRGGHQENWFLDGIPVLNTNIASSVGPVISPKNIESLQTERGGYSSEYGDRTYGFFNVITPSGFDRDGQGELVASYGNFNQTDDQINFGNHSEKLAYYASLDGSRSDLGLMNPTATVLHDAASGLGAFASLLDNATPRDQLRLVLSLRGDQYQIPNTPEQQSGGIRDLDNERDGFLGFSWTRSAGANLLLTVSPFVHFNRADYQGGPGDTPLVLNDNRRSTYLGGLSTLAYDSHRNHFRGGLEAWAQHDNTFFSLRPNPGTQSLAQQFLPWGSSEAFFAEDQLQLTRLLSVNGGLRFTNYSGLIGETAFDPRLGAALVIPRLKWIVRGYVSKYYQPPPLDTVSGPLLSFALAQGYGFIPLHGERDLQQDVGLTAPLAGWQLDLDYFRTSAGNFLDHDEIGNSDVFLPLTDLAAIVRGTEAAVRSPKILGRARMYFAWSNQVAEGLGPITGGLLEFAPTGYFFLDHDQRNTVSSVATADLPWRAWFSARAAYGSGFLNGNGPAHLPAYSSYDFSLGKAVGEKWRVDLAAVNLTNARFMIDNSNTFGGTHWVNPRQVYVEVRREFHW
jgi:hypothetical protein